MNTRTRRFLGKACLITASFLMLASCSAQPGGEPGANAPTLSPGGTAAASASPPPSTVAPTASPTASPAPTATIPLTIALPTPENDPVTAEIKNLLLYPGSECRVALFPDTSAPGKEMESFTDVIRSASGWKQMEKPSANTAQEKRITVTTASWSLTVWDGMNFVCLTDQSGSSYYSCGKSLYEHILPWASHQSYWSKRKEKADAFSPKEIHGLVKAQMVMSWGTYTITDANKLSWLEKRLGTAKQLEYGTACPFSSPLFLTRSDGKVGMLFPAEDSCNVFRSGEKYYQFSGNSNEEFWKLFGILQYHEEKVYDDAGNLIKKTSFYWNTPGAWFEYEYDEDGRCLSETYHTGDDSLVRKTIYQYNEMGKLLTTTLYDNGYLEYRLENEYDSLGNLVKTTRLNKRGEIESSQDYTYDAQNNS